MARRRNRKLGPVGSVVFGAVFTAIGLFVALYFGKPVLDKAKASEAWPSVPGVITHSDVASHTSDGKRMYRPDVRYDYQVEGQRYEGSTLWFGGDYSSSSSSRAGKVVSKYPVDREVTVHYDPEAPYESVLEPGAVLSSYAVFAIGGLFAVVGALLVLGGIFGLIRRLLMVGAALRS